MITFSLQSGSNGNSIYVEAGGVRLLFDAGISGKQAEGRMRVRGRDLHNVDALLISHDHSDHVRCAGVLQRKFGMPIYMTKKSHGAVKSDLGKLTNVQYFNAGDSLEFDGVTVHTVPTPHDAADGVAFVVEHKRKRLGILTDLGYPFEELTSRLETLDAAYLESNYDPDMLESGPYPWNLKQRIRGAGGHLSNEESARLIQAKGRKLQWVALSHLSEENNDQQLAIETHRQLVGRQLPLYLASRHEVSDEMEL